MIWVQFLLASSSANELIANTILVFYEQKFCHKKEEKQIQILNKAYTNNVLNNLLYRKKDAECLM